MNKKTVISVVILVIVAAFLAYLFSSAHEMAGIYKKNNENQAATMPAYTNTDYGFTFSLPSNWNGYSIVKDTWEGNNLVANTKKQSGPKILIRNPNWIEAMPYEDIPVLVFTLAQWASYQKEDFAVSAAPIPASELGRNNKYVLALPPRWDFDYSKGVEEAETIVKNNTPLKTFDLK